MRIERVAERHVPRVVHDHREVVLCGHTWTEHILVALVAVVRLRVQVERLEPRIATQVQFPWTVCSFMCAAFGMGRHSTCCSVLRTVEPHPAPGVHLLGRVTEPP